MRCPKCFKQHPKKYGKICSCGYRFVFMPDQDNKLTDGKFLAILRKAGSGDGSYYTFPQLYWAWCDTRRRQYYKDSVAQGGVFLVVICIAFFICKELGMLPLWTVLLILVFAGMVYRIKSYIEPKPADQKELDNALKKWSKQFGKPEKLLMTPTLGEPPPDFKEKDIYDYGVERIIIVERSILVDLLVKNGFHAEHKSLIVSVSGYPRYIQKKARLLLEENPTLPVCLLHDASSKSKARMRRTSLPVKGHPVHDLGAFPEDFKNLKVAKPLGLKAHNFEAPLDAIPYRTLAAMAGVAVASLIPFEQVVASAATYDTSSFG